MLVILIRTLIIFSVLVIVMRLMGKRQIGEMQPFEFVVTLIIADLACIPMADVSIPLLYGIVSVLTLFLLHQLLSVLEQFGDKVKGVISGKPSLVLNKDGVDMKELKKNNMTVDDLIESMRTAGYFSLDSLDYAVFESNGKLSAFPNTQNIEKANSLPLIIVSDGKIVNRNLDIIKSTKNNIISFLEQNNSKLKNVEVLTIDGNGRAYLKDKGKKFRILSYNLPSEVKW